MSAFITGKPTPEEAETNCVYLSAADFEKTFGKTPANELRYLRIKDKVFVTKPSRNTAPGEIGLNRIHRDMLELAFKDQVKVAVFKPTGDKYFLSDLLITVDFVTAPTRPVNVSHAALVDSFKALFTGHFFLVGQRVFVRVEGATIVCDIKGVACMDMAAIMSGEPSEPSDLKMGLLIKQTQVVFEADRKSLLRLQGGETSAIGGEGSGGGVSILNPEFNFEKMGIGGLDKEFGNIFRRAFASRIFPPREIAKYGIKHVRGMLLFGPPGTGKTLMARQIGKMLNATEPKIISGPEILNKYVGESEENIRKLFADAEREYKERGDDSSLHIIIFDEIDAICKARGTRNNGTGVGDTVVNQLLAKLDGVNQLNNILVIGMTNRKEMIDEALLRPGRLEVHMEIGLPDEHGRLQIINIHTSKMRENKKLAPDVDLALLAKRTKNYSGAEIEGLVKNATAYALNEVVNADDVGKNMAKQVTPVVKMVHFECALQECVPAFGLDQTEFDNLRGTITPFGEEFARMMDTLKKFAAQVQKSDRTPLVTCLLSGDVGCGKTSVALEIALGQDFPFVKLINPSMLVAYPENIRCEKIAKVFEDAHKSPLSVIVVDDIERIVDYVAIGPRFSNNILQTLAVYLKMPPPKGRKLLVIGTTSKIGVLRSMEITDCFNATLEVPNVQNGLEAATVLYNTDRDNYDKTQCVVIKKGFNQAIPVKKLLMISEMAKQGPPEIGLGERFLEAMATYHVE